MVAVAYQRLSLVRDSKYSDLNWKRWGEVVANRRFDCIAKRRAPPIWSNWLISLSVLKELLLSTIGLIRDTLARKWKMFCIFLFFADVDTLVKRRDNASSDTYKVVDAIIDGLTSQRPQTRYVVGLDAKLGALISYLPTFIADRLMTE